MKLKYILYRLGFLSSYQDPESKLIYRRNLSIQGVVVIFVVVTPQLISNHFFLHSDKKYEYQIVIAASIYIVLAYLFFKGKAK